jgi:hypothetical protein
MVNMTSQAVYLRSQQLLGKVGGNIQLRQVVAEALVIAALVLAGLAIWWWATS